MNAGTEGTIDTKRLIFPALGGLYQSIAPYSYAIIRFCAPMIGQNSGMTDKHPWACPNPWRAACVAWNSEIALRR